MADDSRLIEDGHGSSQNRKLIIAFFNKDYNYPDVSRGCCSEYHSVEV